MTDNGTLLPPDFHIFDGFNYVVKGYNDDPDTEILICFRLQDGPQLKMSIDGRSIGVLEENDILNLQRLIGIYHQAMEELEDKWVSPEEKVRL